MDNKNEMIETNQSLDTLIANSIDLIQYARQLVAKQVNLVQLMTYYSLGKWIVEVQQEGQERAQYGKKVIKALSDHLTEKFGRGFSKTNLEFFRRFYLIYEDRIAETVFRQFAIEKTETVFRQLEENPPFIVSWSHYLQLMRIENKEERSFYEIESAKSGWGIRTLQRQYNSSLYERLALSRDKDAVMRKKQNILKAIWKPLSLINFKSFCLSWVKVISLRQDRNDLLLMKTIIMWIWSFIIDFYVVMF